MASSSRRRAPPRSTPIEQLLQARASTLLEAAEAMERNAHACAALSSALEAEAEETGGRLGESLRARAQAVRLATKASLSHARVFRREAERVQSDLEVARSRARLRTRSLAPLTAQEPEPGGEATAGPGAGLP